MAKTKLKDSGKATKMKGKAKNKKTGKVKGDSMEMKKKIADMSVDDMFSMIQDDDSDADEDLPPKVTKGTKKSKKAKKKAKSQEDPQNENGLDGSDDDDLLDDEDLANASNMSRKDYLKKLKESDPEFYKTMMQSSEVMDLKSSDEEEESEDDDDDDEEEEDDHEDEAKSEDAPDQPDVEESESEGSDMEINDEQGHGGNITTQMISDWEEKLRGKRPKTAFSEVSEAFLAAIESLSVGKEDFQQSRYLVRGPQCFNAVVRLCLKNMAPALKTMFKLRDPNDLPSKSKQWKKYRNSVKPYLRHMITLTEVMVDPSAAEAVLRNGVLPLIPFYAGHETLAKLLARRLIKMWATSDKKVRVMAFMGLFRLSQILHGEFLDWMLKKMYIAYVQNCRFTSPSTWGLIDFMRVSLVEMYCLDHARAYKHAFVYIRQMAIHLRNAILLPKKDRVQLVYNWQYIHCLNLWCDLLGKTHPSPVLQPVIFPVTQVAIGTMKLQPTPTFFPLAFHVCRMLTELSRNTGVFIPVMPFLLEIISKSVFFKQAKKASVRPFDWMCILRLSRGELKESAFKDGVIDQVYDIMIRYLSVVSYSIGFPDFAVPTVIQLKAFFKKCKTVSSTRKFKHLLDKIRENSAFIENKRKDVKFGIADSKAVKDWEISIKQMGTPLGKYYENWRKVKEHEQKQRMAESLAVKDFDLKTVKKREMEEGDVYETDEEEEVDDEEGEGDSTGNNRNEEEETSEESSSEEDDSSDEDDESGPPKKKVKADDKKPSHSDFTVPHNGKEDVLQEFNLDSSNDDDDSDVPDRDDYGVDDD